MRTNYVLIDFESVQPASLVALEQEHFRVLAFVGANQAKVPFDVAAPLQRMGDKAQYIKISGNGPNALDFHVAFYIGELAAGEPGAYFHVISKDTGFDPLIKHLRARKIWAARSVSIEEIPFVKAGNTKSAEERAVLFFEKLQQPKVTRPRTEKTLSSALASFFQKQISDEEVAAVIAAMRRASFIDVLDGKITYGPMSDGG